MITILDYNMGNVGSVKNALTYLGRDCIISNKPEDIKKATHLILPGVGAFGEGMKRLSELDMIQVIKEEVLENKKPFLGICLGMQLLAEKGEEGGLHQGLGLVKGLVRKFDIKGNSLPVPHMGWNDVKPAGKTVLFKDIPNPVFYFVHSYFLVPNKETIVSGACEYGEKFTAAIEQENIFGVQFHPEKSQKSGLKLLENFLDYKNNA